MASEVIEAVDLALSAILAIVLSYACYRAFQVRNSLSVRLYRKQALWNGAIAMFFGVILALDTLFIFFLPYNNWVDLLVSVLQGGGIFALFGWIDTSTLIARRSDPLLRNTIKWSAIRKPIWALLLASYSVAIVISIAGILAGQSLTGKPSLSETVTLSAVLLVPFLLGAVLIPLDARRSGDLILRSHLQWLSVSVLALVGVVLVYGSILTSGGGIGFLALTLVVVNQPATDLAFYGLALVFAYSMLRGASSLAPINRILPD